MTQHEAITWLQSHDFVNLCHPFWDSVINAFSTVLDINLSVPTSRDQLSELLAGVEMRSEGTEFLMLGVLNCPEEDKPWTNQEMKDAHFQYALLTYVLDPKTAH